MLSETFLFLLHSQFMKLRNAVLWVKYYSHSSIYCVVLASSVQFCKGSLLTWWTSSGQLSTPSTGLRISSSHRRPAEGCMEVDLWKVDKREKCGRNSFTSNSPLKTAALRILSRLWENFRMRRERLQCVHQDPPGTDVVRNCATTFLV